MATFLLYTPPSHARLLCVSEPICVPEGPQLRALYRCPRRSRADVVPHDSASAREDLAAMGRRLYVGNLPYKTTDEELTELFSRAGAVDNVRVMRDQATGRARGFAFVEMVSDDDAQKAISEFHQYQMDGRALVVNEARPKPAGGDFGGGGGGRGGYGGGGGGRREPRW